MDGKDHRIVVNRLMPPEIRPMNDMDRADAIATARLAKAYYEKIAIRAQNQAATTWKSEPIEMSLADAMAGCLMPDTLIRTQDGMVWRKMYGASSSFERLTTRDGRISSRGRRFAEYAELA